MADPYAELPYPGLPYARTHPDHLARCARRHDLRPVDPDGCTVLEVACGDGLNLIGMAAASPGVRVTGFDLDGAAIARGQAMAEALELGDRVRLQVVDLMDVAPPEPADYVICHGLYTWVPPRVADAALATVAAAMGPDSIGLLSLNVMPGWLARRTLGGTLARRGRGSLAERAATARALLADLAGLEEREDPSGRCSPPSAGAWTGSPIRCSSTTTSPPTPARPGMTTSSSTLLTTVSGCCATPTSRRSL